MNNTAPENCARAVKREPALPPSRPTPFAAFAGLFALAAALAALCFVLWFLAAACRSVYAYTIPEGTEPPVARALSPAQAAAVIERASPRAAITMQAWMLKHQATNVVNAAILDALSAALADTRANIPETAGLTDREVLMLYLSQLTRDVTPFLDRVPTNTVEYLIGAGMRADLETAPAP